MFPITACRREEEISHGVNEKRISISCLLDARQLSELLSFFYLWWKENERERLFLSLTKILVTWTHTDNQADWQVDIVALCVVFSSTSSSSFLFLALFFPVDRRWWWYWRGDLELFTFSADTMIENRTNERKKTRSILLLFFSFEPRRYSASDTFRFVCRDIRQTRTYVRAQSDWTRLDNDLICPSFIFSSRS